MLRPDYVPLVPNEELKKLLLHDELMVRETVAFYLHESWCPDEDLIPLVLQGCRRFGEESSFVILSFAGRFRLGTAALLEAVQYLERSQPPFVEEWLSRAPLELVKSHQDLLRSVLSFSANTRLERRRAYHRLPTTELWRRLTRACHRADVGDEDEERRDIEDLEEALSRRESGQAIREKILELDRLPSHRLKRSLIALTGAMKLHDVTRALIDRLGDADDSLAESVAQALSRVANPSSVRRIGERYREASWSFRLYALQVLQGIKSWGSEALLRRLLVSESDPALRGRIFDALRFHFTEEAAEVLRHEIREPTSWMLSDEIKKALWVNAQVLGRDDPEAESWLEEVEPFPDGGILFDIPVMEIVEGPLEPVEPASGDAACPCGSGKRYDACCGAS